MKKNKMLFLRRIFYIFLLVTFFCIFSSNAYAASFNYDSFNWDSFVKQHPDYWTDSCYENDEDCKDDILLTKEKFYTRLYQLLAEYQRKGFTINDNIIIETVFFGLTPDSFKDSDPNNVDENIYNIDENELNPENTIFKHIAADDGGAKEYFEAETDSLKTLLNNMIGYKQICYGKTSGTIQKNEDGVSVCSDGSTPYNNTCVDNIESLIATYWDKIGITNLLGTSENSKKCEESSKEKNYNGFILGDTTDKAEYDIEFYWKFLKESDYFDKKPQLQKYYQIVLNAADKKSMTDPAWGATKKEQDIEKLKYKDDIEDARQTIIDLIKDILDTYINIYGESVSMQNANSVNAYWWPIGSDETTQDGDIIMASGDPSSVNITSSFGYRTSPKVGMHHGVDISGVTGETNIIAARDGVVAYSALSAGTNCPNSSTTDDNCGNGYGNYVVLQHSDGNYTLYGHMQAGTITLKEGDSVKQGQVVGIMGSSGSSTGGHLHFEVRLGANNINNAVEPLTYISADNPRAVGGSTEMLQMLHNIEGTGKISGNSYVVYNDGTGTLTVGHGVAIKSHIDKFKELGVDVSNVSVGALLDIPTVDKIESQIVQGRIDSINSALSNAGISLKQNQLDALVIRSYNYYDIDKFIIAYKNYGDTQDLYDNLMCRPVTGVNVGYMAGLEKRRKAEWKLFHEGIYS